MILRVNDHINLAMEETEKVLNRYTYPVFVNQVNERPDLIASSVMIELFNKIFILTASHVLDEVASINSPFYIGVEGEFIALEDEFIRSANKPKDHFDIAFMEVSRDFAEEKNLSWLTENRVIVRQKFDRPHLTAIHGYPNSKNKQVKSLLGGTNFKSYAYSYSGKVDKEFARWADFGKHKHLHVCMKYGQARNTKGQIVTPPSPSGLSGGGLWVIPDSFNPTSVYLEAIFIEYFEFAKVSFATKMSKISEFIKAYA